MKAAETVILKAKFDPKAKTYYVLSSCLVFVFTIIGIVLLPIWIPVAFLLAGKWFNSLECVLTDKTLRFKKGVLIRTEKTVPLDKITDLGSVQGPIMRALGIENLTIETAGSTTPGALMSLAGIIDPQNFRDTVLAQKEKLALTSGAVSPGPNLPQTSGNGEMVALLSEIRDSLKNLENQSQSVVRVEDVATLFRAGPGDDQPQA